MKDDAVFEFLDRAVLPSGIIALFPATAGIQKLVNFG